jgi:N6-L-threonylcarbamoyladenine synthase
MRVLGIESTCDETAVAIVEDGVNVLSHVLVSQVEVHRSYGGVFPEIASRHHADAILPLVEQCIQEAGLSKSQIDLVAVAYGPGLIGSLLVGIHTAKAISWTLARPLVGVNHVEAHLYAALMSCPNISQHIPALGLILSGGHSTLLKVGGIGQYQRIGQTADDALGEAFDKVAKMLNLPYPGGPEIERRAIAGDPFAYPFRSGTVKGHPLSFSFSGLKTAVLYTLQALQKEEITDKVICNICASFQRAVFDDIVSKLKKACDEFSPKAIFIGGGVSQNQALRHAIHEKLSLPIFWPRSDLCSDNAIMIAGLGFHVWNRTGYDETFSLEPRTRIPFSM